ncbi:MAG: DUF1559 domain-containing protein [Planctomycetes bacterium]|nr:DUF1559 domain-containing protein [Planctomycetota bacterium]
MCKRRLGIHRSGFSAIEVFVVMSIVAMSVALMLPAIQQAREASRTTNCRNNLRQVGIALQNYVDRCESFPPGYITRVADDRREDGPGWGWAALLLADLDQRSLLGSLSIQGDISNPANSAPCQTSIKIFQCSADPFQGIFSVTDASGNVLTYVSNSHYVAINGNQPVTGHEETNNGAFVRNHAFRPNHFPDGLSQTLFVGERGSDLSHATWTGAVPNAVVPALRSPATLRNTSFASAAALVLSHCGNDPPNHPSVTAADATSSFHAGGAYFLLGDGSVHFLNNRIAPTVFSSLASRAGGEMIGDF